MLLILKKINEKHWDIIQHISGCALPLMIGFRKKCSLRNFVVKADRTVTPRTSNLPQGNYRCGRYTACKQIIEGTEYFFHDLKDTVHDFFANCSSSYVVYLITFLCLKNYVGSTTRQMFAWQNTGPELEIKM